MIIHLEEEFRSKMGFERIIGHSAVLNRVLQLVKNGCEGGIRTPDSLATISDFESGAFNRALPPLRVFTSFAVKACRVPETLAVRLDATGSRLLLSVSW